MDTDTRNAILGKIGHQIGGENTLILFNLIETFPDRLVMLQEEGADHPTAWMRRDDGAYLKLHMDSKKYYESINQLIGLGLLAEVHVNKKVLYKINFEALDTYKPDDVTTGDVDGIEYSVVEEQVTEVANV